MTNIVQEAEQCIASEVAKVKADIVAFWNTEEPIVAGELKSDGAQLAGIVTTELVSVLRAVASGTVTTTEQFGTLVTNTYQSAIKAGLQIVIGDAQAAATQAVGAAAATVATDAS